MSKQFRQYAVGALAVGALAGATALALPGTSAATPDHANSTSTRPASTRSTAANNAWRPITRGLAERPAKLLPKTVSTAHPVRVVTTTIDAAGRPVITALNVTTRTAATALIADGQRTKNAVDVELDHTITATSVPTGTDPGRGDQWDFPKMRVADAWPKSTGKGTVVAVIDTGVDASHPDLAGQVLTGYDVINNTHGPSTDQNGHGTHVAGTIAALTGNGIGVSAIAPDTRIMPIRVLDAKGSGDMSDAATGIVYAADHGANVINMSLGSSGQLAAVTNAIAYARSKGVVVVAAAGNERAQGSPTSYPGADPGVIAVAATDSTDTVASYSNKGSYVDVAAPGSSILSTYKGGYAYMSGTSMASPHVAAVAALLKSYNPALTPEQVEKALESSAVDLGPAGKDTDYGYGRIDAAAALAAVTGTPRPTTSASPTKTVDASPSPTKTASASPSPTARKTTPVVTPDATGRLVKYGATVTPTFTVTDGGRPMAAQPLSVCVQTGTATAFACTDATTDAGGVLAVPQTATTSFRIRVMVPATAGTTAAVSPLVTYRVQAAVTVTPVDSTRLTVEIGGVSGQNVQVQRLDGTRWLTAKNFKAATSSTVTGLTPGRQYRVLVPESALYAGITSGVIKL